METEQKPPQTIDDYIARYPEDDTQAILQQIRQTIHEAAPEATGSDQLPDADVPSCTAISSISPRSRTIGFLSRAIGHQGFQDELSAYVQGKGRCSFR